MKKIDKIQVLFWKEKKIVQKSLRILNQNDFNAKQLQKSNQFQ